MKQVYVLKQAVKGVVRTGVFGKNGPIIDHGDRCPNTDFSDLVGNLDGKKVKITVEVIEEDS